MHGTKIALAAGLGLVAVSMAGGVAAKDLRCDVESDYSINITERSLILTKQAGTPRAVVMRQGRLFVDDEWVRLGADDTKRIAEYERKARATMPLAAQIGRDAADIAFTALGEVATGLSAHPEDTRKHLAKARTEIDARLARSVTANRFNGNDLGSGIAEAISEVLPLVIGDIVGGAIGAAFSGDEARIERLNNMDQEIERRVEPRAKLLEQRAHTLCRNMQALDAIDDALDYRLPDGGRLDLIEAKVDLRADNAR